MDLLPRQLPPRVTLARVRVPACLAEPTGPGPAPEADADGLLLLDLALAAGRIAAVTAHDERAQAPRGDRLNLGGRMAWPCPVDLHTHLDKGHVGPRAGGDGSFGGAIEAAERDRRERWTADDLRARAEFGLRCAWAHGTAALRTHLDSTPPQASISWPVAAELRERWAGRVAVQPSSLCPAEDYRGPGGDRLARVVAEHGGVLGLFAQPGPDLDADLDRLLGLAEAHGLDVDLHVDETGDPGSDCLRHLARAVLRRRFRGRVVAGHCCSLAVQPDDEARRTLDLVADAGVIGIVSLPMCNLYLQDRRPGRTPRWRGVTLAHEARARGVPVAFASDNTRDPFFAYGDLDMHEVFREAVRVCHLDHPFGDWPASVAAVPAALMGLPEAGRVRAGDPADLVVFEGRRWTEVLSRPEAGRTVIRSGQPVDATLPSYAELDRVVLSA